MASYFLVFALQCLFPIFDLGVGEYLGLSVVNPDAQAREFTITATPSSGTGAQTGRFTLNAGAQRNFLLNEILGAPGPSAGWIRIDSAVTGCTAYLASGNNEFLAATDGDTSGSTTIVLPHVILNIGFVELAYTDTYIAIVNSGTTAATVTVTAQTLDGTSGALTPPLGTLTVPANGSRSFLLSELLRNMQPGITKFEGYVSLSSNVPISAWQRVDTPLSRSMLRGISTPANFSGTVIPHFVFGGENYNSVVNLVNPGSTTTGIELRAVADNGATLGEAVQITLRAGEGRRMSVAEMFRVILPAIFPPPLLSGHIYIRPLPTLGPAAQQLLVSTEIISSTTLGKNASLLYSSTPAPSGVKSWILPFAFSSPPYFTGYVVANANEVLTVQNDVQVEVVDSAGVVINRAAISLSPGRRMAALVPAGVSGGYLRITSSMPVFVMGAIGGADLRFLDQLPAVPR